MSRKHFIFFKNIKIFLRKANWIDDRGKRHHYSAMRYIDSVMALCEAARQNQAYFPTKYGKYFYKIFLFLKSKKIVDQILYLIETFVKRIN